MSSRPKSNRWAKPTYCFLFDIKSSNLRPPSRAKVPYPSAMLGAGALAVRDEASATREKIRSTRHETVPCTTIFLTERGRRSRKFAFSAHRSTSSLVGRKARESRSEAELPCHLDHFGSEKRFSEPFLLHPSDKLEFILSYCAQL